MQVILRRLTEHVKAQNWFAVALDFCVVVIGILIAFQITNWNEVRQSRLQEQALIGRLTDEFTTLESVLLQRIERAERLVEGASDLVALVRLGEEPKDDSAVKALLRTAMAYNAQVAPPTSFSDALQSGRIGSLGNDGLRRALYAYQISTDWWTTVSGAADPQTDPNSRLSQSLTTAAEKSREASIRPEVLSFDWTAVREAERELVAIHHHQSLQAEAYRLELAECRNVLNLLEAEQ